MLYVKNVYTWETSENDRQAKLRKNPYKRNVGWGPFHLALTIRPNMRILSLDNIFAVIFIVIYILCGIISLFIKELFQ